MAPSQQRWFSRQEIRGFQSCTAVLESGNGEYAVKRLQASPFHVKIMVGYLLQLRAEEKLLFRVRGTQHSEEQCTQLNFCMV